MGFSKKDLGDVVWNSETGRDHVFLTSRPKDIDYPNSFDVHERNAAIVVNHNGRMTVRPSFKAVQTTDCQPKFN